MGRNSYPCLPGFSLEKGPLKQECLITLLEVFQALEAQLSGPIPFCQQHVYQSVAKLGSDLSRSQAVITHHLH